jgi:uncharacterized protein DUF1833
MALSATARRAIQAPATTEVLLDLLTITHPSLPNPLRFVNNPTNVTSRGFTYVASTFQAQAPSQVEEGEPTAAIEIQNIDRAVEQSLAGLTGEPTFTLEVVLASAPDTVLMGPAALPLAIAETSSQTIRLQLGSADPLLAKLFPRNRFSTERFPGLSSL